MKLIITGGMGFIGSNLIEFILSQSKKDFEILNIDNLTYACNPSSLDSFKDNPNYSFLKANITDIKSVEIAINEFRPNAILNLAAESHVDRSIDNPRVFIDTNIIGTYNLLSASLKFYESLSSSKQEEFRFCHISTDEVFGDLKLDDEPFMESNQYKPSSPYSASKAGSDHLVRAWNRTFSLPTIVTNCSNNYGPRQHPEKLIPKTIINAIRGKKLPIYGTGSQIRDWLHVRDHNSALLSVLENGKTGNTYNVGACNEKQNIEIVLLICDALDNSHINKPKGINKFSDLIEYVNDRPGHDQRYAINFNKINSELNWNPSISFEDGIKETVYWYIQNPSWWENF
jgi:dTDP-glucose 4,6-dehydratase